MLRVIVNSTPLIVLSNINQLEILKNYIPSVTDVMNQLITNVFYISHDVYNFVKNQAGE